MQGKLGYGVKMMTGGGGGGPNPQNLDDVIHESSLTPGFFSSAAGIPYLYRHDSLKSTLT